MKTKEPAATRNKALKFKERKAHRALRRLPSSSGRKTLKTTTAGGRVGSSYLNDFDEFSLYVPLDNLRLGVRVLEEGEGSIDSHLAVELEKTIDLIAEVNTVQRRKSHGRSDLQKNQEQGKPLEQKLQKHFLNSTNTEKSLA